MHPQHRTANIYSDLSSLASVDFPTIFPSVRNPIFPHSTFQAAVLRIADLGCVSQIPDPNFIHPGSWIQQQQQKTGENVVLLFFVTTNFTQLK
jgi:hypothetical protein